MECITIASTPRHTHITGKNKQSCKFPETQHTSQNITHSHLSAKFFCSLSPFSFILFHSVQVGAICALAKPLTWMALSVSVWLHTSENRLLCCGGIWIFLPSSQKPFPNPKRLCKWKSSASLLHYCCDSSGDNKGNCCWLSIYYISHISLDFTLILYRERSDGKQHKGTVYEVLLLINLNSTMCSERNKIWPNTICLKGRIKTCPWFINTQYFFYGCIFCSYMYDIYFQIHQRCATYMIHNWFVVYILDHLWMFSQYRWKKVQHFHSLNFD